MYHDQRKKVWIRIVFTLVAIFFTIMIKAPHVKSFFQEPVNIMNPKEREHLEEGMRVKLEIGYLKDEYYRETRRYKGKKRVSYSIYMVPYMEKQVNDYTRKALISVATNRFNEFDKVQEYSANKDYKWILQNWNTKYVLKVDGYLRKMTTTEKEALIKKYLPHMDEEKAEKLIVPYVVCDYATESPLLAVLLAELLFLLVMIIRQVKLYKQGEEVKLQQKQNQGRVVRTGTNVIQESNGESGKGFLELLVIMWTIGLLFIVAGRYIKPLIIIILVFWTLFTVIFVLACLSDSSGKFVYYEEKNVLEVSKILKSKKRCNLETAMTAYVEKKSYSNNKNYQLTMVFIFADSTKIRIPKRKLNNLGLIYDLIEKYNISYEDNEEWQEYKKWVFDAEPGVGKYFEPKQEKVASEVASSVKICSLCGVTNSTTDKNCKYCGAVLEENHEK